MRVSKPIILHLPELMVTRLDECLKVKPPNFKYNRIYFYYIIHYVVIKKSKRKNKGEDNKYIFINLKKLKNVTVSNIDRYINLLKKYDILISDNSYEPGVKSLKYKLNEKFINKVFELDIPKDSKLSKRLLKKQRLEKSNYCKLDPHLRIMQKEFMKLNFNYGGAYKWIEQNAKPEQKLSYRTVLNQIEDKRFRYFKRNKTNKRLDTNLTNLLTELRPFIIGDYVSIDLKNSQPFILGILIDNILKSKKVLKYNKEIIKDTYPPICYYLSLSKVSQTFGIIALKRILKFSKNNEILINDTYYDFLNVTKKGTLYEFIIENYHKEIKRKETKKMMFEVLFSRNKYYKNGKLKIPFIQNKKIFASLFPLVSKVVEILKIKTYSDLPIYMQRMESFIFIDRISKELVNSDIVPLTIHDSVIVKAKDQVKTIEIMNNVFMKQIGVIPSFNIEPLKLN